MATVTIYADISDVWKEIEDDEFLEEIYRRLWLRSFPEKFGKHYTLNEDVEDLIKKAASDAVEEYISKLEN